MKTCTINILLNTTNVVVTKIITLLNYKRLIDHCINVLF